MGFNSGFKGLTEAFSAVKITFDFLFWFTRGLRLNQI